MISALCHCSILHFRLYWAVSFYVWLWSVCSVLNGAGVGVWSAVFRKIIIYLFIFCMGATTWFFETLIIRNLYQIRCSFLKSLLFRQPSLVRSQKVAEPLTMMLVSSWPVFSGPACLMGQAWRKDRTVLCELCESRIMQRSLCRRRYGDYGRRL